MSTKLNAGRDVEPRELLSIAGGDAAIEQLLWKSLAVTDEVKHLRSHNSIMPVTRLYSREMKIDAVYKSLYTNIFSGSLHNCSDLETTQVSFNG